MVTDAIVAQIQKEHAAAHVDIPVSRFAKGKSLSSWWALSIKIPLTTTPFQRYICQKVV